MKFSSYIFVLGLSVLLGQFDHINCEGETEEVAEAAGSNTDISDGSNAETVDNAVSNTGNIENGEITADNSPDVVDNTSGDSENTAIDSTDDLVNSGTDTVESGGVVDGSSDDTAVESSVDTASETVLDDTPDAPPVGTEVSYDMGTGSAGGGISADISFIQMEGGTLRMICDVSAQSGTDSATFWPDEFPEDVEVEVLEDVGAGGSDGSIASDVADVDVDVADVDANVDVADVDANVISNDEAIETTSNTENSEQSVDSISPNVESSDAENANVDDDTASETVESSNSADNTDNERVVSTCSTTMPHLYILKDTSCCADPSLAQCASVEGKKLGCLEQTGSITHDFTDLTYADVESYCLAITNKEVSAVRRRTPKFISAGPSFFRAFGLLNFNTVNFLSSGTKTITTSSNTGGTISFNYPASSPSYSGSYTPGFFDTLPHIRLEGLTADYLNVIIVLLIISYIASIFLPLLGLGPIFSQLTAPFSRMGDFVSEKVDVLENRVKAAIRKHNRRYYNNVRRVDYDSSYEYDDDDYYYVK